MFSHQESSQGASEFATLDPLPVHDALLELRVFHQETDLSQREERERQLTKRAARKEKFFSDSSFRASPSMPSIIAYYPEPFLST